MTFVVKPLDKDALALIIHEQHGPLSNAFNIFTLTILHPATLYVPIMKMSDVANSLFP